MNISDCNYQTTTQPLGELDRMDLIKTVHSLRRDVQNMYTDIREVLEENEKLHQEVEKLREHGSVRKENPVSNVHRVKQEVDELIRMHEMASSGRGRAKSDYRGSSRRPTENRGGDSDFMKKMMMFMMMAEMV
jgi:hypothetical protein